MKIAGVALKVFIFCLLTLLSQVGGVVFLLAIVINRKIKAPISNKWLKPVVNFLSFLLIYSIVSFLIVPWLARPLGRERLPFTETNHLKPLNLITCILNRNYVQAQLKQTAYKVSIKMNEDYPGTITNYLDAGFPFIDGFPLLPHLSHNDGKKLDLSFYYLDAQTNKQSNSSPSLIGYGICEVPLPDETNTAQTCNESGYWQYSILKSVVPQHNKRNFLFDGERTARLVNLFAADDNIGKLFIEPHLKKRLNLTNPKIKFHGCRAVRHDDHLHVELK